MLVNADDARPLDLDEAWLTAPEVMTLARITEPLFNVWVYRGFLPPGRLLDNPFYHRGPGQHRKRRFHSIADALRAVVIASLGRASTLAEAGLVADIVLDYAYSSTSAMANEDGVRPNAAVLVGWAPDGSMVATTANIKQPGFYYPPVQFDEKFDPLRRPHIYVPATALLIDVVLATAELRARRAWPGGRPVAVIFSAASIAEHQRFAHLGSHDGDQIRRLWQGFRRTRRCRGLHL